MRKQKIIVVYHNIVDNNVVMDNFVEIMPWDTE